MAKIGIDARLNSYRVGGISTYTANLVAQLALKRPLHDIVIFESRKRQQPLTRSFPSVPLWTPPHNRLERLALSAELLPHQLDLLHSPDFIPPLRGARRHIITVHDLAFLHYPQYLTTASRRYYNEQLQAAVTQADHILAVSAATQSDLVTMLSVPEHKITVQPNGVSDLFQPLDLDADQAPPVANLPQRYILHVGTWEPRKNIYGLLQAYKRLRQRLPDAPPVLLVGKPGWLFKQEREKIDALALAQHIIWREDITTEALPTVYNHAQVTVIPSFYEGFGLPALESMACGTPVIASNRSALPEVVGEAGLLVDPDDPAQIADALYTALTDSAWHDEHSAKSRKQAQQFTWERSATIALSLYQRLL